MTIEPEPDVKDPDEAKEIDDSFEENVFSLNREISKHSFLSSNSDSSEQRRKFIQNLKPNSLIFSEEETTYKPPRRIKQAQKQGKDIRLIFFLTQLTKLKKLAGKTGKFFFGKTLKAQTPQKEREPIKCVILDVGGERFIAQRNSLLKYPTTRLGKLMRSSTIQGLLLTCSSSNILDTFLGILALCDEFIPGDPPEYFFDKNPENFSAILEMHRR